MRQGLFLTIVAVAALTIAIVVYMFLPEYIKSGGPLVAGLIMLSIMSVTLVFERLFTISRARGRRERSRDGICPRNHRIAGGRGDC